VNYIAEEVTMTWLESQRVVIPAMGVWVGWSRCFEGTWLLFTFFFSIKSILYGCLSYIIW